MSQKNEEQQQLTTYLKYRTLKDMLKIILFAAQSALGLVPMLYHINYNNQQILFLQTGAIGGVVIHYIVQNEKPSKKFIELNRLTGQYSFAESLGSDTQSLYIPVLELEDASLKFPT